MSLIPFDNSYIKLGEDFYLGTNPTSVSKPEMILFNSQLANDLGLSPKLADSDEATAIFSGNQIPEGADPIAMAYAGHQFGGFSPQLGDGRAILLGEVISPAAGVRYDIQLKGSGPTGFSRNGDGRSALGPVLREYLLSEVMAKFGIPTTRALAAVTTGEQVARTQLLPGAIITRVATSFVRVGTFQYFSNNRNESAIRKLADYLINRNFPELQQDEHPYQALLLAVVDRQAALIAQWMQFGFIHGVMNTDNVSVVGETIDYGPCAFMDGFNYHQVYSSIDHQGRYAYSNQPSIGQWNLIRLAECLLPLLSDEGKTAVSIAEEALNTYSQSYQQYWLAGMRKKLGLAIEQDDDQELIENLLNIMDDNQADFTLTFYYLSLLDCNRNPDSASDKRIAELLALFANVEQINQWLGKWRTRLAIETVSNEQRQAQMRRVNPVYIPRNHQVEAAIRAAEDYADFSVFYQLHEVLQKPFEVQNGRDDFILPPRADEVVQQTFCGT
jgi:uncharacterized protein YdiU (UPF0061 family)